MSSPARKAGYLTTKGYRSVRSKGHPRANNGYVFEHILVAEAALGRHLPPGAEIHHVNGDRSDNRSSNLVICENHDYHMLLHKRQWALEACGNPKWLRCTICKKHDDPANLYLAPGRLSGGNHRACRMVRYHARKAANA